MVEQCNGTVQVTGFKFAACEASIKKAGRLDLALVYSEVPATAAGVFTTNKVVAAPVLVSSPRVKKGGRCQAVLVNSGNANACTGNAGMQDALFCSELVARALDIDDQLVAVASTGVIGHALPMEKFAAHIPDLPGLLGAGKIDDLARAMMTTDSFAKVSARRVTDTKGSYTMCGVAKGAGMIHPNMATMLGFVMTDAKIEKELLDELLKDAVDRSFNSITVDRDTSTNDMVLVLANGQAGGEEIRRGSAQAQEFQQALREVLLDLAKMIVRDGEGATKLVEIHVRGAIDDAQARQAAFSVATSNLVKTAFFGEDANWGRIIAAVGYSGAEVDPNLVEIFFNEVPVVRDGLGTGAEREAEATQVLKKPEFTVTVDLHVGEGAARYYTSDLTYDYVRINADYRT